MLRGRGTTAQHSNPLDGHHLASVYKREQLVHRRTAETYTAHLIVGTAIQSNTVYLPPGNTCAGCQRRLGVR